MGLDFFPATVYSQIAMGEKILIIDDDLGLSGILKAALEQAEYEVFLAETAAKGIEMAENENPSLILLDFMLPDQNGIDVLKKLKENEKTKNIPVTILSNFAQENTIKQSLNDGAIEFWIKYQVGPEDIIDKVKTVLNESKSA